MSKKKKEVFTRIDYELYEKIREKGYKLPELIELGFKYKENQRKILTEEYIFQVISEFNNIANDIKKSISILKLLEAKLNEIESYINKSKHKIGSKFFPSKYDMINTLEKIEEMLKDIKKLINGE